jgi:hypothetical protein
LHIKCRNDADSPHGSDERLTTPESQGFAAVLRAVVVAASTGLQAARFVN